jgi:hypothetical protein
METLLLSLASQESFNKPMRPVDLSGLRLIPGAAVDAETRAVHELLELLDDAMFEAIAGGDGITAASQLWERAVTALPRELLDESREQYLRVAIEAARRDLNGEGRDPLRAIGALEVLALLAM